jgi:hypothetical protein
MSAPSVELSNLVYTFTLQRGTKAKEYSFGEHSVEICAGRLEEFASWELLNMRDIPQGRADAVDADGKLYYIFAMPEDVGRGTLVWITKAEALILKPALIAAEEDFFNPQCTFCGQMESACGGDHGDEMREIQREALQRD